MKQNYPHNQVTKWLIPNVEETAKSENDHIFERADIDKVLYMTILTP